MKLRFPAFAALLGVSLAVACSSASQQQAAQQAAPLGVQQAAATPTPTPINMNQGPPRSCGTNGPGRSPYYDAYTGQQIVTTANEVMYSVSPQPFGWPQNASQIRTVHPSAFVKWVFPMIPIIAGRRQFSIHDEVTIAVLPYANSQQVQLFNDYVHDIVYNAMLANEARTAQVNKSSIPIPTQAQSDWEKAYYKTEQPLVQAEALGTTPDDTDYLSDPGNPDGQDRHYYDYACNYMDDAPYALVMSLETRIPQYNTAYTVVKATLAANAAPTPAVQQVGYVPNKLITCVALPVRPIGRWDNPTNPTPSPNVKATLAADYQYTEVARIDLSPIPPTPPATAPPPGPPSVPCVS